MATMHPLLSDVAIVSSFFSIFLYQFLYSTIEYISIHVTLLVLNFNINCAKFPCYSFSLCIIS
uniref:Uncharacterized protein n=1 Tax=Arundo donax TaxID=35708 RepID=A0A0A9FWU5_ARUDO